MKKSVVIGILMGLSTTLVFANDEEKVEQKFLEECKAYAKEDKVGADELEAYLDECVKEMKEAEKESAEDKK